MPAWYARALRTHPLATRAVTAAAIAAAGDVACQLNDSGAVDAARTLRFSSWALLNTPFVSRWYVHLGARFPASPARRVLADQLLWAPPATAACLFYLGALEAGTAAGGAARAAERLAPTLAANWTVWPAVQAVNFGFVPPAYQILFSNVVGLGWSFMLSRLAATPPPPPPRAPA